MSHTFLFLDDIATADLAFDAFGDSPQELFQAATDALIEAMADPQTVCSPWQQTIEREDEDLASLLFDWLCDMVYWKDAAGVVFHRVHVTLIHRPDGFWNLNGLLSGEPVNGSKQALRADVKGVTKHLYCLSQEGERWTVRVVLDI